MIEIPNKTPLLSYFHVQIKINVLKVVLYQVHAKKKHLNSFGIWESLHCFSSSMFPKITLLCFNPIPKQVSKSSAAEFYFKVPIYIYIYILQL